MNKSDVIAKYVELCRSYGVDVQVVLSHEDSCVQKIEGTMITLNEDQIPEAEFEAYLTYNVRKILLPRLALDTGRLILRGFRETDAEDCFAFLSDRQCCYNDGGYEPFHEMNDEYRELMDKFASQPLRKMILFKGTGKVIGTINLFEANDRAVEAYEIGYVVSPACQRKGYGFEAVSAFCECLLTELHADMIIAGAIEENRPSNQMLRKLGFQYEGRKTKAFYHPAHGAVDLLYYVKEREHPGVGSNTGGQPCSSRII